MLKMRLQRIGRKNDASFRVIVTDSRRGPKSGKHIDILGSYNPKLNQATIDGEKAKVWISKGVQVSDTLHNLLINQKIIEGKKINVLPKKTPIIDEAAQKAAAEAAAKAEEEAKTADAAPAPEEAPATETPEASQTETTEDKEVVEAQTEKVEEAKTA